MQDYRIGKYKCRKCCDWKLPEMFMFHEKSGKVYKNCKECTLESRRRYNFRLEFIKELNLPDNRRMCRACMREFDISNFYIKNGEPMKSCKSCNEKQREAYHRKKYGWDD